MYIFYYSLVYTITYLSSFSFFFFFNDTATTEIYTLSLHDALPICPAPHPTSQGGLCGVSAPGRPDRKSTRLNSSHVEISYAVFCLKKKKTTYCAARALSGIAAPRPTRSTSLTL